MVLTTRTLKFVLAMLSLLFIPFFAMQLEIAGWDWDVRDFTIMSVLLSFVGVGLATATCTAISLQRRILGFVFVGFLVLLYIHLAVGIVDTWPLAGS